MKRLILFTAVLACAVSLMSLTNRSTVASAKLSRSTVVSDPVAVSHQVADSIYRQVGLEKLGLKPSVFFEAYKGYQFLLSQGKLRNPNFLTIVDYSQSSVSKRLYVIDLTTNEVMYNTYVAHGRNSGNEFSTFFSNRNESKMSSLGFMVTGETYNGHNGFSMRLDGVEPGFNDQVRRRAIVMHGSKYVNGSRADIGQMMGRSFGCPALPCEMTTEIINTIKNGSCYFAYYPDTKYATKSAILNASFNWPVLGSKLASVL